MPPLTNSASNSSRGPTLGVGAGSAQPVVVDLVGRRQHVQAGQRLQRCPLPNPDQGTLAALQRLGHPQRSAEHRIADGRRVREVFQPHRTAVEHRRGAGRPQRRFGGGHRPAPQVGPVPMGATQRVAGPVTGLGDARQLHQRGQRVSRHKLPTYPGGAGARGMASSSWRVYSCRGRVNSSSVGACSTTRPARITRTSSAICRITARSWLMNR